MTEQEAIKELTEVVITALEEIQQYRTSELWKRVEWMVQRYVMNADTILALLNAMKIRV